MFVHHRLTPCGFAVRALSPSSDKAKHGISQFLRKEFPCVRGVSDRAEPEHASR